MTEKRLVTAALPYINGTPHLGHIVGSHLPADIFARFCRLKGYETLFVGGTDENGSTSEIAAAKLGVDIGVFSDRIHVEHKRIYDWFQISYDVFSRTSCILHHETVWDFFQAIEDNGYIEEGKLPVFFSKADKQFLPDRYVKGTCPKCGFEDASGDQCEKCSFVLEPNQLKNPKSTVSGSAVELVEATHLFFRLDKLSDELAAWLEKKTDWEKQVTALARGWIMDGLKPRCITRDLKHGVKVLVKGFEDKIFYVWFEAPIGYLSFTKEATDDWREFWGKDSRIYNFLGKDNIPFHTIFWPGMIIANGLYPLPYRVIGLQYLTFEQEKFSKRKNKGVFCDNLPKAGIASDIWRYYLTCLIPETQDTEFKWAEFQERVNSDLIANYGNLVNRTLSFIASKQGGVVTRPENETCRELERAVLEKSVVIERCLENCEFREALKEFFALSSIGNKYFSDSAPWKKSKEDANEVLFNCAALIRCLAILSAPFFPRTTKKVFAELGISEELNWETRFSLAHDDEYRVTESEILFKKILPEELEKVKAIVSVSTDLKTLFKKGENK